MPLRRQISQVFFHFENPEVVKYTRGTVLRWSNSALRRAALQYKQTGKYCGKSVDDRLLVLTDEVCVLYRGNTVLNTHVEQVHNSDVILANERKPKWLHYDGHDIPNSMLGLELEIAHELGYMVELF